MRCSILATFSEADTFQAAMRAVGLLRLATTQKGRFRARFSQVTPDRLRLIAVEENLPRIAFVKVPLDRILVAFTLDKSSRQSWNGMRVHAEHLIVLGSGASAHARTDGPSRWRAICLPKQEFARYAHALTGGALRMPEGVSYWHTRSAALRRVARHTCRGNALGADRLRHTRDIGGRPWSGTAVDPRAGRMPVRVDEQIPSGRRQGDGIVRRTVAGPNRTAHGVSLKSAACSECRTGSYVSLVRRVSA